MAPAPHGSPGCPGPPRDPTPRFSRGSQQPEVGYLENSCHPGSSAHAPDGTLLLYVRRASRPPLWSPRLPISNPLGPLCSRTPPSSSALPTGRQTDMVEKIKVPAREPRALPRFLHMEKGGAGQEDLSCLRSPPCQAHPPSLLCWPQAAPKGHRPLAEPLVLPAGRPVSAAHGCGRKGGDVWTGMCPPTRLWLSPAPYCKPSVLPQNAAGARGRRAAHGPGTGQPACAWKGRLTDTCPGGSPAAAASNSGSGCNRLSPRGLELILVAHAGVLVSEVSGNLPEVAGLAWGQRGRRPGPDRRPAWALTALRLGFASGPRDRNGS